MKKLITFIVVAALVGCASFNNNFNTYPPIIRMSDSAKVEPVKTASVKEPEVSAEKDADKRHCPEYVLPELGKTPDIPGELLSPGNSDLAAIEKVEQRHIEDLRKYISQFKNQINKSHMAYVTACASVAKTK